MIQRFYPVDMVAEEYVRSIKGYQNFTNDLSPDDIVDINGKQIFNAVLFGANWQSTQSNAVVKFKMPSEEQIIHFALVFNDGKVQPEKLADMVGMCNLIIDRLYENGDILIPSSKEKK